MTNTVMEVLLFSLFSRVNGLFRNLSLIQKWSSLVSQQMDNEFVGGENDGRVGDLSN